ncbi:virulence factor SrfC family protein [Primorskyibacter sp. S87]|uniref:virulence factor SrfC family protein n=1 Tax=Primorskyibacter sp. S87 TaxID=3415126 RepID=UPI003C7D190A
MSEEQRKLVEDCAQLAALADRAGAWVETPANTDLVGAEQKSLIAGLRRGARRARRLEKAAQSPMSVSVFGPSQAGKSFLVSVLARPEAGPLVADFAGSRLNYIREINPEGEGESTGLVTRFTMSRPDVPADYPIKLTLLGEADLLRVLVNSFFMDGDRSEPAPDAAEIAAHLDAFKSRAGSLQPGLDEDDVIEIGEYVEASFGREAYAAALKPFWEEAARIAPSLSAPDRAAFFALLWGGHQALSDLYLKLALALSQLGHAEAVYAGLNALVPRETSIIDVKTLSGSSDTEPLAVITGQGAPVSLPRSVICALAAELVLPMQDLPDPMFSETDLLDFPGARNRFEQDLSKALEEPEAILPELLLRGKVAYLFDRYVQNQDITSMLLCIPDSNMETVDLPGLVQGWIATTHGATPQDRAEADTVLFLVLTKFDKHLSDSAAQGGDETRFERRMQASLLEKFGKGRDPWVSEWTPDKPFDNCYWLRNPNYYVDGLIDYDDAKREQQIRPDKAARVSELKAGCLQAPSVQRHFANPGAAWDAALTLNDGGVAYLISALRRVCKPDSKLRQIRAQLGQIAVGIRQGLAPYHVSDDVEQRIAEKRAAASKVIDDLEEVLARHRFGGLLAALMVDQEEIEGRIARVPSSVRISSAVSAASADAPAVQRPGGRPSRPTRPGTSEEIGVPGPIRTVTLEQFQADTAMEVWIDAMKQFRDDGARRNGFGLGEAGASDLVAELIHAARRTRLAPRTAASLAEVNFGLTVEKQAQPASILGAEAINQFVATLGMKDIPEADRPVVEMPDGSSRATFAPRPVSEDIRDLPMHPRPLAEEHWTDWAFALDALFVANAKDGAGNEINIDQNLALGAILAELDKA